MTSNVAADAPDPYTILSVPRNATVTEIKSSYRKLALKHHPDKGGDEAMFKEISAAYEILSDEGRRAEYDHSVEEEARRDTSARSSGNYASSTASAGRRRRSRPSGHESSANSSSSNNNAADPFNHPFVRGDGSSSGSMHGHPGFTDPFDLFERVFGEEFGGLGSRSSFRHSSSSSSRRHGSSASSRRSADPFDDPFFSSSGLMGGLGTRGGGMESMMSRMSRQMDAMSSMMDVHRQSMMGGGTGGSMGSNMMGGGQHSNQSRQLSQRTSVAGGGDGFHSASSSSFSMSSSSIGGGFGGGGQSVSTSTTTRMVNGVQETVTERTVVHPDGRVERHVERSGGSGGGGSSQGITNDRHRRYIDQGW